MSYLAKHGLNISTSILKFHTGIGDNRHSSEFVYRAADSTWSFLPVSEVNYSNEKSHYFVTCFYPSSTCHSGKVYLYMTMTEQRTPCTSALGFLSNHSSRTTCGATKSRRFMANRRFGITTRARVVPAVQWCEMYDVWWDSGSQS